MTAGSGEQFPPSVFWRCRADAPGPNGKAQVRAALLSEMWRGLGLPDEPVLTRGAYGHPLLQDRSGRESDWRVSFAGVRVPAGSGPDVSLVALFQGAAVGIDAERQDQPGPGLDRPLSVFVLQEALLKGLGTGFGVPPSMLRDLPGEVPPGVIGCGVSWFQTTPLGWDLRTVTLEGRVCYVAWAVRDVRSFEPVLLD